MLPKKHIIYGGLFALVCYLLFARIGLYEALIIWICSWLVIDLDHAIRYSIKTRNFSPVKFWEWSKDEDKRWRKLSKHEKEKYHIPLFLFHGAESLIILLLLSLRWEFFFWCFIGFLFHLILDWIDLYEKDEYIFGKVSVLWVVWKNRGREGF